MQPQTSAALRINTPLVLTQRQALPSSSQLLPGALGALGGSTRQDQIDLHPFVQVAPACPLGLCASGDPMVVTVPSPPPGMLQEQAHILLCSQQPAATRAPADAAGSQKEAPKSPRILQRDPLPPRPLLPLQSGVKGTAQAASPIGSQLPSLQHGDHSAPLGARLLLQPNNDDIPSSPAREGRETSPVLPTAEGGVCWIPILCFNPSCSYMTSCRYMTSCSCMTSCRQASTGTPLRGIPNPAQ